MSNFKLKEIEELLLRLWTDPNYLAAATAAGALPDLANEELDLRGASVYAAVLKANRLETMKAICPRTYKVAAEQWERLILSYCNKMSELASNRNPDSNHFLLNNMAAYFHGYFLAEEVQLAAEHPYMADLIHFEITEAELGELDVEIRCQKQPELKDARQFSSLAPIINPCLRVLRYQFNIPEIISVIDSVAIDPLSENKEPLLFEEKAVVLLAVRNPLSHKIRIIEVNELTALLVDTAIAGTRSYQDLVALAADHCLLSRESLANHCLELFTELKEQFVIVGNHAL